MSYLLNCSKSERLTLLALVENELQYYAQEEQDGRPDVTRRVEELEHLHDKLSTHQ